MPLRCGCGGPCHRSSRLELTFLSRKIIVGKKRANVCCDYYNIHYMIA